MTQSPADPRHFDKHVVIDAPPSLVWDALTKPALLTQWMGEPAMAVEVKTDWTVGSPITVRGFHHAWFENRGTVLEYSAPRTLRYSQLDSLSRLPDEPENFSVLQFTLVASEGGTSLTLSVSGFPTQTIFKHLDFYWRGTLGVLKNFVERGAALKREHDLAFDRP